MYGLGQPESPVKLTTLSVEEALTTRAVRNARVILGGIAAEPQRLTEKLKLLNRRFVTLMLEQLELDERTQGYLSWARVVDEDGVWSLMMLRLALQYGGLILVRGGKVQVTSRGRELLAVERAGELHRVLFETLFTQVNLALMDGYPEDSAMQDHMPFALFRLGTAIREPLPLSVFADRMPHEEELWPAEPTRGGLPGLHAMGDLYAGITMRVLEPLREFGLIDCGDSINGYASLGHGGSEADVVAWFNRNGDRRWSLTPLFDKAIAFEVDGRLVPFERLDAPRPVARPFPPEHVMSLKEAIDAFIAQAVGQDGRSAEALAIAMAILEVAAAFDSHESTDETPVEKSLGQMSALVQVNANRVDSSKHPEQIAVLAAAFSAFAIWAEEIGQARFRISRRAVMRMEPWVLLDVEESQSAGAAGGVGDPRLN